MSLLILFVFVSVVVSRNLCLWRGSLFKVDLPSPFQLLRFLSELIMSQVDAQEVCPQRAFTPSTSLLETVPLHLVRLP